MAVDVVARALALAGQGGSSNYDDLENKPIIDQDLEVDGFAPVANTYYKHKDNGVEPQPVYSEFVVGENLPTGALMHVDTTKEQEMLDWAETLATNAMGYPFYASDSATAETAMVCGVMPAQTTGSEDAFVIFLSISTPSGTSYLPIYSTEDFDMPASGSTVIEFRKGFHNLDQNGNVAINPTDSALPIVYVGFSPNQSMSFDNFNWNGRVFSICEIAVKPYHDGSIYYYDGEAYHEIIGEGATDDAPILNADFYAEDFKPQNGRFYRQVGTSKKIGPIATTSSPPVYYLDMDCPIEDMTYALEGLERDEIPPVSETGGIKIWSMVNYNQSGEPSFNSLDIYHIPANTAGLTADTDFWLIGMFGGLIQIWNSAPFTLQVTPSESPVSVSAGWHDTVSGQKIIVDGVLTLGTGTVYNFNTQYWNLFASTEPLYQAAKDTIAKYHDGAYDEVALKSDMDNLVSDEELADELANVKLNEYHFTLSFPGQTGTRDNMELLLYRVRDICYDSSDGSRIYSIDLSGGYSSTLGDIHLIRIVNPQIIFDDSSSMPSMFVIKSAAFSYSSGMDQYNIADATFYVRSRTGGQYEIRCILSMNGSEADFNIDTVSVGYFAKRESYPNN